MCYSFRGHFPNHVVEFEAFTAMWVWMIWVVVPLREAVTSSEMLPHSQNTT
jgi:hypothetical protein